VSVGLDRERVVSVTAEVSPASVAAVEVLRVAAVQAAHARLKGVLFDVDDEVVVRRHEAERAARLLA
jgi:hypothetical protein